MSSLLDLLGHAEEPPPDPSPDALLLELMDLVTLAFPEPLHTMTVRFRASEDGKRPALTDLDGKAAPGQPKRPDLGHSDNAVLDAINALLVEFADATDRQGGVRVLNGHLEMVDGPDGDRLVELREEQPGAAPEKVMSRRFDSSELRWLFWTAPLFRALEETAPTEDAQRVSMEHELRRYQRFDIDMSLGRISFSSSSSATPPLVLGFQLLGSWSDDTKRFLWGWANDQIPPALKKKTDAVRAASTGEGLRALHEGSFGCPERCAERLARHAAVRMGARGTYRAPFKSSQGKGVMYLALEPSSG